MVIKRGDVYYADLRPVVGSEQGGVRPVLIIQNDIGGSRDFPAFAFQRPVLEKIQKDIVANIIQI